MSAHVVVDPITRIEGHLRIEAETDDNGAITSAYSSGTMVRGIELILKGRDPRDAWAFAQRICGVCTLVHGMLDAGVYLAPSQFEAGFLSTAHSEADIEKTVNSVAKLMKTL